MDTLVRGKNVGERTAPVLFQTFFVPDHKDELNGALVTFGSIDEKLRGKARKVIRMVYLSLPYQQNLKIRFE